MKNNSVIIVGAGWAGLAAAVRLAQNNIHVTVIESAKQTGGRARTVTHNQLKLDNGQHIMVGAYRDTLKLMQQVGIDVNQALSRTSLALQVYNQKGQQLQLSAPCLLPAPLHILYAFLTAKGLTFKERFAALHFGIYLQRRHYSFDNDISVEALLIKTRQPQVLITNLWEPLCLAIMNTHIKDASANIFMRVFKDAFTNKKQDSNLLLPKLDLSALFPDAVACYLKSRQCELITSSRVEQIQINDDEIIVQTANKHYSATNLIIATSPQNTIKLIRDNNHFSDIKTQLEQYEYEPITTVYLKYPDTVSLPSNMIGLTGTLTQWVFDRGQLYPGQKGLLAVVISASGEHMQLDNDTLAEKVHDELKAQFAFLPQYEQQLVIKEKKATFASKVNINKLRPDNRTTINGVYLAGDYTNTDYPATLEGAVRSGLKCATEILSQN